MILSLAGCRTNDQWGSMRPDRFIVNNDSICPSSDAGLYGHLECGTKARSLRANRDDLNSSSTVQALHQSNLECRYYGLQLLRSNHCGMGMIRERDTFTSSRLTIAGDPACLGRTVRYQRPTWGRLSHVGYQVENIFRYALRKNPPLTNC